MAREVSVPQEKEIEEGESEQQERIIQDYRVWLNSSVGGPNLFSFAWARAAQNKPLNEGLLREYELIINGTTKSGETKEKDVSNAVVSDGTNQVEPKEEEELEEGEIKLDGSSEQNSGHDLMYDRAKLVRDILDCVTVNEADDKSFHEVCDRLTTCLDHLGWIVSRNDPLNVEDLIDKAFNTVHSVFKSKQNKQKKEALSRLLSHLKTQVPAIFSPEQMKEIQAAMDSPTVSSSFMNMDIDMETKVIPKVKNNMGVPDEKSGLVRSSSEGLLKQILTNPEKPNNLAIGSHSQGLVIESGSKGRGSFSPLIDLHGVHAVDSLPSPTREAPPPVYFQQRQTVGDAKQAFVSKVEDTSLRPNADVKSVFVSKIETKGTDTLMRPDESDDFTAVFSYQQKIGPSSFHSHSRLPSPTPSEENDGNDNDTDKEVSSLSAVAKVHPSMPLQDFATQVDNSNGQQALPTKAIGETTSRPKFRLALKRRDPRLGLFNPEIHPSSRDATKTEPVAGMINSRKNKNVGDNLDNHALKKQKNESTSWDAQRDVHFGGLDNCNPAAITASDRTQSTADPWKSENRGIISSDMQASSSLDAKIGETEQLPAVAPSLLEVIAGNQTMLVQLIMEQQRLAAEAQGSGNLSQTEAPTSNLNPTPGATSAVNVATSKSIAIASKPAGNPQTSMNSQVDGPKIPLKPRDPRRVLFDSTFQNHVSLGAEKLGVQTSAAQGSNHNLSVSQHSGQAQATCLPSQSSAPPDINLQFTKNLRDLADILSSQSTNSFLTVAGNCSSQRIPNMVEKVEVRVPMTDSMKQAPGTPIGVTETPRPQSNTWGDVEHLFGAYDDNQKAAIQRERIRRMEEQNRMFAAKKLCLVLDLDHTLLNSAKFDEVEPVHEEILKRKEEQDREKPWRHLFRLSHMGMWTKLRPGIWTFLEKASKLYELHLYTMGNNSYAKEMAKLLDPRGTLFAGRVIAKGDDGDPFDSDEKIPKWKDLDGVLGMESSVVIMDDSVQVWPHNKLNLIAVERYTYFPCSRRQFGLVGPSLLEIDRDERPDEGTLASSLKVIERIHQSFFSNPSFHGLDVRNILAAEQRKILAGSRILFSRIFPVGEANPHQHPLWQTAEQFGAVCTTQIDNMVTHVVALSLGTDKVNWALATGRYVVRPGWVEASALLYRRANEKDFAVKIGLP